MLWSAAFSSAVAAAAAGSEPGIYFHDVPACARQGVQASLMGEGARRGAAADPLTDAAKLHLREMLRQILAVEAHLEREHRVWAPEDASLFFIPAYFPLLFWRDQSTTRPQEARHLACINETFRQLERQPFFSKNAGYDQLILYGYEYPHWKRLEHLLLEAYSPFAANALILAVSFWSQGRRSGLLGAGLYALLRVLAIPYYATWDCSREAELLRRPRDITVAFAGSVKDRPPYFVFRERLLVAGVVERPPFANDSRVLVQVFPADDAQRHAFARDYAAEREALYLRSDFCLVMPGDGNTAGRLFDSMMLGCVPVFLFHPDSYPVVPFASRVPWREFAIAKPVRTEQDAAAALEALLATPAGERSRYRRQTLGYAPLVALALTHCPEEAPSALSMISADLRDSVHFLHSSLLPRFTSFPLDVSAADWLCWGPGCTLSAGSGNQSKRKW